MSSFEAVRQAATRITNLHNASAVLAWDQEVNMPSGGAERRASVLGTLASEAHRLKLEVLRPAVEAAQQAADLSPAEAANLAILARDLHKSLRLPDSFVAELAAHAARSQAAWEDARHHSDFARFAPALSRMVELQRQAADLFGYEGHPYNALLDEYDTGSSVAYLDGVFGPLKPALRALLARVQAAPAVTDALIRQPVAEDRQWAYSLEILKRMGYDFAHGRQDRSSHPFSISFGPEDVRVTTRLDADNIQMCLFSAVHEGGHALYEQGLSPDWYGLPQSEACSLSIHEANSRIWENNIARSLPFWQYHFPSFAALFPDGLAGRDATDVFRAVNAVAPSLIRIQADELTYHFHVIIRYEIEQALIGGSLQVADLPAAWNAKYQEYLGVTPPNDAQGCLQDVHWSHGSFGYFPTYSLGSFYAAQFAHYARQAHPALDAQLAAGDLQPLKGWLAQHVWPLGKLYASDALCQQATGEGLNVQYFLTYLEDKLRQVYGF